MSEEYKMSESSLKVALTIQHISRSIPYVAKSKTKSLYKKLLTLTKIDKKNSKTKS